MELIEYFCRHMNYQIFTYFDCKTTGAVIRTCKYIHVRSDSIWKQKTHTEFPGKIYFKDWNPKENYLKCLGKYFYFWKSYSLSSLDRNIYQDIRTIMSVSHHIGLGKIDDNDFIKIEIKHRYILIECRRHMFVNIIGFYLYKKDFMDAINNVETSKDTYEMVNCHTTAVTDISYQVYDINKMNICFSMIGRLCDRQGSPVVRARNFNYKK